MCGFIVDFLSRNDRLSVQVYSCGRCVPGRVAPGHGSKLPGMTYIGHEHIIVLSEGVRTWCIVFVSYT